MIFNDNFTAEMQNAIVTRLEKLKVDIAHSISAHGLTASGRTAQSLEVVSSGAEVALYGRAFFPALETGSIRWIGYTGVRCTFLQFKEIIRNWVTAKGLNFGQAKKQERTIGAITAKIIREGSKQRRSGQRRDIYSSLVDEAVADCGDLVADVVGAQVNNIIANW